MSGFSRPLPLGAALRCSRVVLRSALAAATVFTPYLVSAATPGRFTSIPTYSTEGPASFVVSADIDGDDRPDAIVSTESGAIVGLLSQSDGSFSSPVTIANFGSGPNPIAVGDFNRDGRPDLAVVDVQHHRISVYLGLGHAKFSLPFTFSIGATPGQIAVGDVNGDGNQDIVLSTSTGFSVLLGNGQGLFRTQLATLQAQSNPNLSLYPLALGDVNGDGILDVVTSDGVGNIMVYLGEGNGQFRQSAMFQDSTYDESQLVLADLNGDHKLDLIVGNFGFQNNPSYGLVVLWGDGAGNFGNPTLLNAGFDPASIVVADLNGDGMPDLAVANAESNSVSVILNRGDGRFAPNVDYATTYLTTDLFTPAPGLIAAADFNGDGHTDLAVATSAGMNALINLGGGRFKDAVAEELWDDPLSLFAQDLNGDGKLDLAVVTGGDIYMNGMGSVYSVLGNGAGRFSAYSIGSVDDYLDGGLAVADFDGDGKPDIAVTGDLAPAIYSFLNQGKNYFTGPAVTYLPNPEYFPTAADFNHDGKMDLALVDGYAVDVQFGLGDGTFQTPQSYRAGSNPVYITVADLNGDGLEDLVVADRASGEVDVLLGKADGTFAPARAFPAGSHPVAITVADFNHDGKLDLAVGGDKIAVLLGRGDGSFESPIAYSAGAAITFITHGKLRGNDVEDLLVTTADPANGPSSAIQVLYGKGNGAFFAPALYYVGASPTALAVKDFNGDGAPDVVVANFNGSTLSVLLNQGGTRISLKSSAASVAANSPVTLTASVAPSVPGVGEATGAVVFKDGGKVLGSARLTGGKATFTSSELTKGSHAITVEYQGNGFFNPHVSPALTQDVE